MGGGSGSGRGAPIAAECVHDAVGNRGERRHRSVSDGTESTKGTSGSSAGGGRPPQRRRSRRGRPGKDVPSVASGTSVTQQHHPPKGLLNLGNTCYANAALQCLMATALSHALMDPRNAIIFRRYASNTNILSLGSGSADTADDDDWLLEQIDGGDDGLPISIPSYNSAEERAERERRREERRKRREERRKEKKKMAQRELCRWLTGEMTDITRAYTAAPRPPPAATSGLFSIFSSPPPRIEAVDPGSITRNVHKLCKTLCPYQQEDAHEFLRALLSVLVMDGQNRHLSALFDGLLESAVTCQTCRYASLTRDRYMDLSLDIADNSINNLLGALRHFTKTEKLDADNMVTCARCKEKRIVTKGLRLATAPTVLVCHLKRFAMDCYGRTMRLNKDVLYPEYLEIDEYMSRANRSTPPPYQLVGVLVHCGRTCDSGHYLAFIKSGPKWFKANDSVVSEVPKEVALNQKAYILVYEVAGMREKHGCSTFSKYHTTVRKSSSNGQDTSSRRLKSNRGIRSRSAPRPVRNRDRENESMDFPSGVSHDTPRDLHSSTGELPDCFSSLPLFSLLGGLCGSNGQVQDEINEEGPTEVDIGGPKPSENPEPPVVHGANVPHDMQHTPPKYNMARIEDPIDRLVLGSYDGYDDDDDDLDISRHAQVGAPNEDSLTDDSHREQDTKSRSAPMLPGDFSTPRSSVPVMHEDKDGENGINSKMTRAKSEDKDEEEISEVVGRVVMKRSTSSSDMKHLEQNAARAYRSREVGSKGISVGSPESMRQRRAGRKTLSCLARIRTGSEGDARNFRSPAESDSDFSDPISTAVSDILVRHRKSKSLSKYMNRDTTKMGHSLHSRTKGLHPQRQLDRNVTGENSTKSFGNAASLRHTLHSRLEGSPPNSQLESSFPSSGCASPALSTASGKSRRKGFPPRPHDK